MNIKSRYEARLTSEINLIELEQYTKRNRNGIEKGEEVKKVGGGE